MEFNRIEGLCRLCGLDEGIMVNIFEPGTERVKKINKTLPITVSEHDPLPKMLCHHCLYKVNTFFEFRNTAIKSQEILKNMVPWIRDRKKSLNKAEQFQMVEVALDSVNTVSSDEREISPSNRTMFDISEGKSIVIEDSPVHLIEDEDSNSQSCERSPCEIEVQQNSSKTKKSKRSKSLWNDKKRKKKKYISCQIDEVFSTTEQVYENLNNIENIKTVQHPFDSIESNMCAVNSPNRDISVVEKGILTDDKGGDNIALPKYMLITKIPRVGNIYTCEKCGVTLLNPQSAVQHHCRGVEEDRQKEEPQHCEQDGEKDSTKDFYQCSECGQLFTRHSQLAFHMKKHNNQNESSSDDNSNPRFKRRRKHAKKRHKKSLLCTSSNANSNTNSNTLKLSVHKEYSNITTSHITANKIETPEEKSFFYNFSPVETKITRHSLLSSDSE